MGFKKTSETIAVSFGLTETAPATFIQDEIALQLDVLNNEIFVVVAVDLDLDAPDAIAGANTSVNASVSSTSLTTLGNLSNTNVIANGSEAIRAAGFIDSGVTFTRTASSTPIGDIMYISLIATNNFFVQLDTAGNPGLKSVNGRLWGYRARADSSTYAALVQSEVLSA
tara:strand:+ start:65 stop:571 length:507 start_codon:yes stop_codon:yes gene_type:complete